MYLLILEDGAIRKTNNITPALLEEHSEGLLDIINISGCDNPRGLEHGNNWEKIEKLKKEKK